MVYMWGADKKMAQYLRPQTLYSNKFEGYLNMKEGQTQLTQKGVETLKVSSNWIKKEKMKEIGNAR